jgi:sigma-54 specific flagellar transcriptional regulator A
MPDGSAQTESPCRTGAAALAALVGGSPAMADVRATLAQVAPTDAPVLLMGPSGSGKELAARAVHALSARAEGPFVALNCGAVPRELLESELFGHERGAFTGAQSARVGRFEAAEGGTLFLDEIGEMPLDMQVALLRVLEERAFERVGSTVLRRADVRIVAATHRDLPAQIAAGRFREDLWWRLSVFPVPMPPLAARAQDVPELVAAFVDRFAPERRPRFTPAAMVRLMDHEWPGNVRELRNVIERAAIRGPGALLDPDAVDALIGRVRSFGPAANERAALWSAAGALGLATGPMARGRPAGRAIASPADGSPSWPVWPAAASRADGQASLAALPEIDAAAVLARGPCDLRGSLSELERQFIEAALAHSRNIVADAARLLGLQRTTLVEKMRRMGLAREAGDGGADPEETEGPARLVA